MANRPGHHILYPKVIHESQKPSKELRRKSGLIVPLEPEPHNEIHRANRIVPIMGYIAMNRVLNTFHPVWKDYDATICNLMSAIEETIANPRMDEIERNTGHLMIEALEIQRPYIKDGRIA